MQSRLQPLLAPLADLTRLEVQLIETVAVVIVLLIARALLLVLMRRHTSDARTRYRWSKGITYGIGALSLIAIGRIWFVGFSSITTFLGIAAAGLVIALKEPILNTAGWLFLISRRPFVVGDRIQIGDHSGDVIDQRLFEFSILEVGNWVAADQSTGRVIHLPNSRVFTDAIANYTRGFPYIWNEVQFVVTFESDWRAAKALLQDIAARHGRALTSDAEARLLSEISTYMIFYATLAPAVYTAVTDRGIALSVRYLCEVRRRRDTEHAITEDVLVAFGASDAIDLAYPTRRFFDRAAEGPTLTASLPAGGTS
jgi:small-conductance mechanosensitive channel